MMRLVLEQDRAREVGELERAEDAPLAPGVNQARRHDGPARPRGRAHPRLRRRRKRHPEPAKARLPQRAPKRRVAARDVLVGRFRQPDQHQPPIELRAVPPLQHPKRRVRRIPHGHAGSLYSVVVITGLRSERLTAPSVRGVADMKAPLRERLRIVCNARCVTAISPARAARSPGGGRRPAVSAARPEPSRRRSTSPRPPRTSR